MISTELQKKIDRAIRLLQSYNNPDEPIEIAYSGGKDSDVILQLAKEAGINYRAIYKNTTIDPPGTIKHAMEMRAEVMRPEKSFFQLIEENGLPNRFMRFCCKDLKEYKVLNKVVMGVRQAESKKRAERYTEPSECKYYGAKTEANHVEAIYPIHNWSDQDVVDYITDRNIPLHPLYYKADGTIDPKRRLGCMGCPLKSPKKRNADFVAHPLLIKAYAKALSRFRGGHTRIKTLLLYDDEYEQLTRDIFFTSQKNWNEWYNSFFGKPDCKKLLEDYFHITL